MAVTPEKLTELANAVNASYGAGTIDINGDIEAQLAAFIAKTVTEYQTQLNNLARAAKRSPVHDMYKPDARLDVNGVVDGQTAIQLLSVQDMLADITTVDARLQSIATGAALETINQGEYNVGRIPDAERTQKLVDDFSDRLHAFDAAKLGVLIQTYDALHEDKTLQQLAIKAAEQAEQAAQTQAETDLRTAVANAGPQLIAARDWINANIDSINALIDANTKIPAEGRAALKLTEQLPQSASKLSSPALIRGFSALLATNFEELFKLPGAQETFKNLEKFSDLLNVYNKIYMVIGTDTPVTDDPVTAIEQAALLNLKATLAGIDKAGILGDFPDFALTKDPFNPVEPDFVKSFSAAIAVLETNGLSIAAVDAQTTAFIDGLLQSPEISDEDKTKIRTLTEPHEKVEFIFNNIEGAQQNAAIMMAALKIGYAVHSLPAQTLTALQTAVGKQLQSDIATAEASAKDPAAETATATEEEPEVDIRTKLPDPALVTAVEFAYKRRHETAKRMMDKPDGFYDLDIQLFVRDTVEALFAEYGHEFITVKQADGTEKSYAVDKSGNIYNASLNADGTKTRTGEPVGKLTDGIVPDAQGKRPHEATVAFITQINEQLALIQQNETGNPGPDAEALERTKQAHEKRLTEFFAANPALGELEAEFRGALKSSRGLNADQFKSGGLGKRMKDAAGDAADLDTFIVTMFALERELQGYGADYQTVLQQTNESAAISALLGYMGNNPNYDPKVLHDLRNGAIYKDNVLDFKAYAIIDNMRAGETIPAHMLYDEQNIVQKAAVLQAFGDQNTDVSREQIYAFVRRQIDLRALQTLDPKITAETIAALKTPAEQDAFIARNADTLDGVSAAMSEGEFNPYEKDLHLVFKAFDAPDFTQSPQVLRQMNIMRDSGVVPNALYLLNNMSEEELATLTGRTDFADLTTAEQAKILDPIAAQDPAAHADNPAFMRTVMNFYEPHMGNFTWQRNGAHDDNSLDSWNGRYGEPTQTQIMHHWMAANWFRMDEIFGAEAAEIFFERGSNRSKLNLDLTYEEAMAKLGPAQQATLNSALTAMPQTSTYVYFTHDRVNHYRRMRETEYLPRLADRRLAEEFAKKAAVEVTEDPRTKPDATVTQNPGEGEEEPGADDDAAAAEAAPDVKITMPEQNPFPKLPLSAALIPSTITDRVTRTPDASAKPAAAPEAPKAPTAPEIRPAISGPDAAATRAPAAPEPVKPAGEDTTKVIRNANGFTPAEEIAVRQQISELEFRSPNAAQAPVNASADAPAVVRTPAEPPTAPEVKTGFLGGLRETIADLPARLRATLAPSQPRPPSAAAPDPEIAAAPETLKPAETTQRIIAAGITESEDSVKLVVQDTAALEKQIGEAEKLSALPSEALETRIPEYVDEPSAPRRVKPVTPQDPEVLKGFETVTPAAIDEVAELSKLPESPEGPKPMSLSHEFKTTGEAVIGQIGAEGPPRIEKAFKQSAGTIAIEAESAGLLLKLGKIGQFTLRALPWIGAGMATIESGYLLTKHDFLKSAGLLPEEASTTLMALYATHIAQSGGDPTAFGGEVGTREWMLSIAKEYNLDPVTIETVSPNFFIDYFTNDGLTIEQYETVKGMFTEDRLQAMYTNIAKAHNLPETVKVNIDGVEQEVSIGVAMRNEELASEIAANYAINKRRNQGQNVDQKKFATERQGLEYIRDLNKMAGIALGIVEDNQLTYNQLRAQRDKKALEAALEPAAPAQKIVFENAPPEIAELTKLRAEIETARAEWEKHANTPGTMISITREAEMAHRDAKDAFEQRIQELRDSGRLAEIQAYLDTQGGNGKSATDLLAQNAADVTARPASATTPGPGPAVRDHTPS